MNIDGRTDRSRVAVIRCDSYDPSQVRQSIARGFQLLGNAVSGLFSDSESVLLKPNMLQASPPEQAACTHPEILKAAAGALQSLNLNLSLSFGDSPAVVSPQRAANRNGLSKAAETVKIPLADFKDGQWVMTPDSCLNRRFYLANGVVNCDAVVSLSKLKTHGFTRMTGAIKNQFGCIPGLRKAEYHAKYPRPLDFSRMLVELSLTVAPRLYIMDAVLAMEGNGPNSGEPRPLNTILISTDPVALDATAARLIGVDPHHLDVISQGEKLGLGTAQNIETVGTPVESVAITDFKIPKVSHHDPGSLPVRVLRQWILSKPVIDRDVCVACGQCTEICPVTPGAVFFKTGHREPRYNYSKCIRCFCCQEVCPAHAIDIHTPMMGRLLHRLSSN